MVLLRASYGSHNKQQILCISKNNINQLVFVAEM
jgi:hypothetical protein